MNIARSLVLSIVALACLSAPALGQLKKGVHYDHEKGYRIKPPRKWTQVPVDIDEKWIVLKYIAHRSMPSKSGYDHRAQLRVIVFPHDAHKESGVTVKRRGNTTYTRVDQRAYRDYKDYVRRNQEAGYFFTAEEEAKSHGAECMQYEVKLEKGTQLQRRYVTWVFKGTTADYAVEFECLDDHFDRQKPAALRSLRTFEFIERTGSTALGRTTGQGSGGGSGGGGKPTASELDPFDYLDRKEWKALPAKDRKKRKQAIERRRWKKSEEALTAGWRVNRTKNFLFLSHCDQKYTKRMADASEACWSWLEKEFGKVSDEYVMRGIIRICQDREEARAYMRGSNDSRSFDPKDREVVIWKDASVGSSGGYENLYYYLLNRYMVDKDLLVFLYLPPWLRVGLGGVMDEATPKRKRLKLEDDPNDDVLIRIEEKNNGLPTVRELMEMQLEDFVTDRDRGPARAAMAAKWTRWLLGREGKRTKETKTLVVDYIRETVKIAEEIEAERIGGGKEATSEAEEEARARARQNAARHRAKRVIKQLQDVSFQWTDKEWKRLDQYFRRALTK